MIALLVFFIRCKLLLMCVSLALESEQDLAMRLVKAKTVIEKEIHDIKKRWDINHYPNFLKSPALTRHAWDIMKLRLQHRIVATTDGKPRQWLIAFMGSSVTAGRNSPVDKSITAWMIKMMQPAFAALNIEFKATNNAVENNPCIPYDLCVKAFAGIDADMVHWEQTYYCEPIVEMYEQFTRQSLLLPSEPIVIFSSSATGHWPPEDCNPLPPAHEITPEEEEELRLFHMHQRGPKEQFTERNIQNLQIEVVNRNFKRTYAAAAIQTFHHSDFMEYKCLGPYGPDFGEGGAVKWHPSMRGQELRASHYALLWLHVLLDAVVDTHYRMQSFGVSIENLGHNITHHLHLYRGSVLPLPKPLHSTDFVDTVQCFTDFETRNDRSSSLRDKVIATKLTVAELSDSGWTEMFFFKRFLNETEYKIDLAEGRPDQILCLVGNDKSGMIHLSFNAISHGTVFVCFAQGFWGVQPPGFIAFSDSKALVFLTRSEAGNGFVFDIDATLGKSSVQYDKKPLSGDSCLALAVPVEPGPFVLSISVPSKEFVAISTVLVP